MLVFLFYGTLIVIYIHLNLKLNLKEISKDGDFKFYSILSILD